MFIIGQKGDPGFPGPKGDPGTNILKYLWFALYIWDLYSNVYMWDPIMFKHW